MVLSAMTRVSISNCLFICMHHIRPTFPPRFYKAAWLAEGYNSPDIFPQPRTPVYHDSIFVNATERFLDACLLGLIWWHCITFFPVSILLQFGLLEVPRLHWRRYVSSYIDDYYLDSYGSSYGSTWKVKGNLALHFGTKSRMAACPEVTACSCCWVLQWSIWHAKKYVVMGNSVFCSNWNENPLCRIKTRWERERQSVQL